MSLTVVLIRMPPALADEVRKHAEPFFSDLMNGKIARPGFVPKADVWADGD